MAGRPLATAFVRMRPDSTGFRAEATAQVKASTAGVKAEIPLTTNDTRALLAIANLNTRIKTLTGRRNDLQISTNDKQALLDLARVSLKLDQLKRTVKPDIDPQGILRADVALKSVDLLLDRINGRHVEATVSIRQRILGALAAPVAGLAGSGAGRVLGLAGSGAGAAGGAAGGTGQAAGGAFGALPPIAQAGIVGGGAAIAALAAPFIAQIASGAVVTALGTGLAGLGIAGAIVGQGGLKAPAPPKGTPVTTDQLTAAQDRLNAAELRVTAAQDRLNKLQSSGKTSASQLATAHAALASAEGGVASAQDSLNKLQAKAVAQAPQQATQTQQAFQKLSTDAKASLVQIGIAFVPVMKSIFDTADSTLKKMTPVFAGAERVIAAPFQSFVNTIIRGFAQPAVAGSINAVAKAFGDLLKALAPQIPGDIRDIAVGIQKIAEAIDKNPGAFAGFISFLFKLAGGILTAIADLTLVATYIEAHFIPAWNHVTAAFITVHDVLRKAFGDVVSTIVGAFTGATRWLVAHGSDIIQGLWSGMIAAWNAVTRWFAGIGPTLGNYFHNALTWLVGHGEHIIQGLWDGMIAVWVGLWRWFNGIFPTLTGYFRTALTWLVVHGEHIVQGLWNGMIAVWNAAWHWFTGIAPTLGGYFRTALTWLLGHGEHIIQGLWDGLIAVWNQLWHWFNGIAPTLGGYFRTAIVWLFQHGRNVMQGLWNGIINVWGALWHWFNGIAPTLGGYFRTAATWLLQHGRDIIAGLFRGMIVQLGNVGNWVRNNIFNPIVNGIKSIFGIHSPSTVMAGLGAHLVDGFIKGMLTGNIADVINSVFGSSTNALLSLLQKGILGVGNLPQAVISKLQGLGGKIAGFFKGIWDSLFGGGGGGSAPSGAGISGGEMANGLQLYHYLLTNVFRNSPQAAAGATASIWGESTWNPFAQGSGGRGLIGWTPPGTISNADFLGGMATQLPAIVRFISTSGDWGVINQMINAAGAGASVASLAWMWGRGVERFGIPDVHPQGIALASSFIGRAGGGIINEPVVGVGLRSGAQWRFGERGDEWVTPGGRPPGVSAAHVQALLREQQRTNAILAGLAPDLAAALNGVAHRASSSAYYGVRN